MRRKRVEIRKRVKEEERRKGEKGKEGRRERRKEEKGVRRRKRKGGGGGRVGGKEEEKVDRGKKYGIQSCVIREESHLLGSYHNHFLTALYILHPTNI